MSNIPNEPKDNQRPEIHQIQTPAPLDSNIEEKFIPIPNDMGAQPRVVGEILMVPGSFTYVIVRRISDGAQRLDFVSRNNRQVIPAELLAWLQS